MTDDEIPDRDGHELFEDLEGWYVPHRRLSALNYLNLIDFKQRETQEAA